MKYKFRLAVFLTGMVIWCCSCGKSDIKEMGRYVESVVTLPDMNNASAV